jgi:hypothetical protein
MIEVIDALRELLEPTDAIDESRSENDVILDRSCAQPFEFVANTLYAWEELRRQVPAGTGEIREDFEIRFVYVSKASEEAGSKRNRDVSIALDAKADGYLELIRNFANIPPWDSGNIQATVDADMIRQLEVRGIGIRVIGYRMVTGQ